MAKENLADNNEKSTKKKPRGKPWIKGQSGNPKGAPKRGKSWAEAMARITGMTREQAIDYVGKETTIGRALKELSPKIPIKDALIFIAIIAFGRDPNARMLTAMMDREEGRPPQAVDITSQGEKISWRDFIEGKGN